VKGGAGKRAFDVAAAIVMLLALAPLFLLVAVAVKLDSPGPVLFRQERVGRRGRRFRMVKFRTMVTGADALGPNVSATEDRRITRVGRVLRRAFLDEAPQLLNVLKGEMSLVGPRPETPEYVALLSSEQRRILCVRPGMTGPSTLAFSAVESGILAAQEDPDRYYRERLLHERIAADLRYVEGASLSGDLLLLLRTAGLVLAGLGPPPPPPATRSAGLGPER
jgi:lipopolysaccharide/colanic/teichoic acid biosynthesis glycosyltransferase